MRRGRIFIYLALIIIIGVAGGWLFLRSRQKPASQKPTATQATPVVQYVQVVSAGQNITAGTLITEAMLSSYPLPQDKLVEGLFTDKALVVNMYAKMAIQQGVPITASEISAIPGNVNLPGSAWALSIPQGLTAVSIPFHLIKDPSLITILDPYSIAPMAAFGIRNGDYVDVIVTLQLVDIDPTFQSLLPNLIDWTTVDNKGNITVVQGDVTQGRFETDQDSKLLLYVKPSETQRPRMVTQMIMQDIQVLYVGPFPLPGEATSEQLPGTPTPTPNSGNQQQAVPATPDIVTVMVSPQDAVMLTYLVDSNVKITLTLRNPNDQGPSKQPDAAMLEYLLTQYNIPVPAKLPYAIEPTQSSPTH